MRLLHLRFVPHRSVQQLLNQAIFQCALVKRALSRLTANQGDKFVAALVTSSSWALYSPSDEPPPGRLYIIIRGVAINRGYTVLGIGDNWGEDDVLLTRPRRTTSETRAMTYLKVMCIDAKSFLSLELDFPEAFKTLRTAALWKQLRRKFVEAAKKHRAVLMRQSRVTNSQFTHAVAACHATKDSKSDHDPIPSSERAAQSTTTLDELAASVEKLNSLMEQNALPTKTLDVLVSSVDKLSGIMLETKHRFEALESQRSGSVPDARPFPGSSVSSASGNASSSTRDFNL